MLTDAECELLFHAWALHARGKALAPDADQLGDCDALAQRGWLTRRVANDTITFSWSDRAEASLQLASIHNDAEMRQN
jgi:hypothetical protein